MVIGLRQFIHSLSLKFTKNFPLFDLWTRVQTIRLSWDLHILFSVCGLHYSLTFSDQFICWRIFIFYIHFSKLFLDRNILIRVLARRTDGVLWWHRLCYHCLTNFDICNRKQYHITSSMLRSAIFFGIAIKNEFELQILFCILWYKFY